MKPFRITSRRSFLKSTAALAAASTLPSWFTQETWGAENSSPPTGDHAPGFALIGCGGMGRVDAKSASRFGRLLAVCDLDDARIAEAKKQWPDAAVYKDFRRVLERKDIEVVICGTVDHWHALISLAAMRAGKDVYCEKPLTLTIDEGKHLVKGVRDTRRILQTGSQQRSDKNFRLACELVRNGRIGKVKHVDVWLPSGRREGPFQPSAIPAGFDYEFWMGPTPNLPYVKERTHFTFRYWWDYSGGTMTDWGAHHNDIALWALGYERSGPVQIEGKSFTPMIPGGFSAFSEYEVNYTYANGVTQTTKSTPDDNPSGGVIKKEGQRHGVKFTGTNGWIWVTRGSIQASDPDFITTPLHSNARRLYASDDHMGNFFSCVASRKAPICEAEIGHRSASLCHLGVIAARLGRPLSWSPKREEFSGDKEANQWLAREMRAPWTFDKV